MAETSTVSDVNASKLDAENTSHLGYTVHSSNEPFHFSEEYKTIL